MRAGEIICDILPHPLSASTDVRVPIPSKAAEEASEAGAWAALFQAPRSLPTPESEGEAEIERSDSRGGLGDRERDGLGERERDGLGEREKETQGGVALALAWGAASGVDTAGGGGGGVAVERVRAETAVGIAVDFEGLFVDGRGFGGWAEGAAELEAAGGRGERGGGVDRAGGEQLVGGCSLKQLAEGPDDLGPVFRRELGHVL